MLLLTLPGPAFLYQGDEIGQGDGPPGEPPYDRAGRDRYRHPMQWDALAGRRLQRPASRGCRWWTRRERNVEDQRDDPGSMLSLVRELIALRRELGDGFELLDAADGVLAYRARRRTWWRSTPPAEPLPAPLARRAAYSARRPARSRDGALAPHAGAIAAGLEPARRGVGAREEEGELHGRHA